MLRAISSASAGTPSRTASSAARIARAATACASSPASLSGHDQVAATWVPDISLAAGDGKVRPEFMSAALDCPGYFAARSDGVPMLLGEFTRMSIAACTSMSPASWSAGASAISGRKYEVGTALFDDDGDLCARARALWIEPKQGAGIVREV